MQKRSDDTHQSGDRGDQKRASRDFELRQVPMDGDSLINPVNDVAHRVNAAALDAVFVRYYVSTATSPNSAFKAEFPTSREPYL